MRTPLLVAILVLALSAVGCGPAENGEVPDAAQQIFDLLRERRYDAIYDGAAVSFRKSNTKADFVERLRALESFGQLAEIVPAADPSIVADGETRFANARYTARFAFAEGPFELTLRSNDMLGTWELAGYDYNVEGTTYDPPYPADAEGADQLARRFFYLWQVRRYGDLRRIMRLDEDPQKVRQFFENLENGGRLLRLDRVSYEPQTSGRRAGVLEGYSLTFDNGKGTIVLKLVEVNDEWRLDSADYQIEYKVLGSK
jgi:hypothetical protein